MRKEIVDDLEFDMDDIEEERARVRISMEITHYRVYTAMGPF